jgi:pyruvate/2-oxoglutarate dehydrogenase complex dihydrolipoamide dehydrogenase (E3) component
VKKFDLVLLGSRDLAARVFAAVSPRFSRTAFIPSPSADDWRERFSAPPVPFPFPPASDDEELVTLPGLAAFLAPDRLSVGGEEIAFRRGVLLSGAEPILLGEAGAALRPRDALVAAAGWSSAIVIGAGPTGVGTAQRLAKRSVAVTLLAAGETILPHLDADIARAVETMLQDRGVVIERGVRATNVRAENGQIWVDGSQSGRRFERAAAGAIAAMGLRAATAGMNLDKGGILIRSGGGVATNDEMRTSNPRVYAAGAVAGTRVTEAMERHQAAIAAANLRAPFFNRARLLVEPAPAVFPVEPGLAALDDGNVARAKRSLGTVTAANNISGETFIKLVADRKTGALHSAQALGRNATEIVLFFDLARQMELSLFDLTEQNHFPDLGGRHAIMDAIEGWQKAAEK